VNSSKERARRTADLLSQIQQQRLDLSAGCRDWEYVTSPLDRGWKRLLNVRTWAIASSSLAAIWSIRHPRFLMRWGKRALGVWSSWRLLRKALRNMRT
jgi:hypothetical protein